MSDDDDEEEYEDEIDDSIHVPESHHLQRKISQDSFDEIHNQESQRMHPLLQIVQNA
jgi:hypothetical protein